MAKLVTPYKVLAAFWLLDLRGETDFFLGGGVPSPERFASANKLQLESIMKNHGKAAPASRQNVMVDSHVESGTGSLAVAQSKNTASENLKKIEHQVEGIDKTLVSFDKALTALI